MKAKKIATLVMAASMVLGMAACGNSGNTATTAPASQAGTTASAKTEATTKADAPSGNAETSKADVSGADDCPTLTTTDPITIIWAHNSPEVSAAHQAALKFQEEMESRSGGVVKVKLFPNGESGTVPENDQALREGTIQIMSGTAGGLADPSLSYFDLPCLVSSAEDFEALFGRGTELRDVTEGKYNDMGMHVLSLVAGGFGIISSNKEIRSYEDMAGLNIRTSENSIAMEMFKDWGCNPTPVAFSELYIALQQGLVEAQNNTLDTTVSAGLHEQQKYIIDTRHSVMPLGIYMNLDFYNNLPEDVRALLDWVCENIIDDYTRELVNAADASALKTVKDAGLEVIAFTDEDRAKMLADAKPVYDMVADIVGQDLIDRIGELQAQ